MSLASYKILALGTPQQIPLLADCHLAAVSADSMSDLKATFDLTRKRLRHKLGLPAALPPDADASAASSDNPGSGVSVLHRVLAYYEDHKSPDASSPSDYDIIPLPAALSHSLSGTWKQRIADNGKPFWERDAREAASTEVSSLCPAAAAL